MCIQIQNIEKVESKRRRKMHEFIYIYIWTCHRIKSDLYDEKKNMATQLKIWTFLLLDYMDSVVLQWCYS